MITIRELARKAGVSVRTVTRVLSGEPHVSEKTRQKVQEAIRSTGYTPNLIARSMVKGRTGILGLSITSVTSLLAAPLIKGVIDQARKRGYRLILSKTAIGETDEPDYLTLHRSGLVDGVILASHVVSNRLPKGIEQLRAASLVNYAAPGVGIPQYLQDNEGDAYQVTHHLLKHGARKVALINGPPDRPSSRDKRLGYERAHRELGVPYDSRLMYHTEYTEAGGASVVKDWGSGDWPEAIFAASDLIAVGVLREARRVGVRIPDDVLLGGFDNHPFGRFVDPPLTTVQPDMSSLGVLAVDAVVNQLEGEPEEDSVDGEEREQNGAVPIRAYLTGKLIVRASSRPPLRHRL